MAHHPSHNEEEYFHELEREQREQLRKKLEQAAAELREQRDVADSVGTDDATVAQHIKALGFDGDSARVFDLLPLIHVAWADGNIQRAERSAILGILRQRSIEPGTAAFRLVESLLERRPDDTYMQESLHLLRKVMDDSEDGAKDIVDLCVAVADASGGFLGMGNRIDDTERKMIEEIASILGDKARAEFKRQLG